MNYVGLSMYDTANGPGVRISLFVSGCTLHCRGCFNEESWCFRAGNPYTPEIQEKILQALSDPFVDGLSLLGGDPLEEANEPVVTALCREVRARFGNEKSIWLWTGRRYEKLKDRPIMQLVDVLVDGPFVEAKKVEGKGLYYGSANQRVIHLKEMREKGLDFVRLK